MQYRNLFKAVPIAVLLTPVLSGCEIKTLYEVRLSDLNEANTTREFRRNRFSLFAVPSPGTDVVFLTLIASAEPRPNPEWTWSEFGNWPQARRDATFSDWFDRVYLDVSVSGNPECPLQIQHFDHRKSAQQFLYANWLREVQPVHRFAEGTKGMLIEFPVDQCFAAGGSEDADYAWVVADVRVHDGELLDTVRIGYRIEPRESFVDWWLF
jgi:hypothetical protein